MICRGTNGTRIALATWRASGGSEVGFAAFAAWSSKSTKDVRSETRARWDHFSSSPPTEIGAGSLFHLAREECPGWTKPSDHARRLVRGHGKQAGAEQRQTSEEEWPDPEPLFEPAEAERPYPLDALPPIVAKAVEEYRVLRTAAGTFDRMFGLVERLACDLGTC